MLNDQFPLTVWSQISRARRGVNSALNELLLKYRQPVLNFIQYLGLPHHDAEELTQEVLLAVSRPKFLQKADREKGRFRNLLCAVAKKKLYEALRKAHAAKRGGGASPLSLDRARGGRTTHRVDVADPLALPPDEEFDRLWVTHLVCNALEQLARESSRKKGPPYAGAIRMRQMDGLSCKETASGLGCSSRDVRNYVHRGMKRLKTILLAEMKAYCSSADEFASEVDLLESLWRKEGPQ